MKTWPLLLFLANLFAACGDSTTSQASDPRPGDAEPEPEIRNDVDPPPTIPELARTSPCDADDPPPRCGLPPASFQWGEAWVVSGLALLGTQRDPECCLDINDDGLIDNSAGMNLAGFDLKDDYNATLQRLVDEGADAIVLETGDLDAPRIEAQWWRARQVSSNGEDDATPEFVVTSADAGVQSESSLDALVPTDDRLVATEGTIALPFAALELLWMDADLELLTLERDGDNLVGFISGTVEARQYLRGMQLKLEECDCLDFTGSDALDVETGQCAAAGTELCEEQGRLRCIVRLESCSAYGIVGVISDVDRDGDGLNESVSFSYAIELSPAEIVGIGE